MEQITAQEIIDFILGLNVLIMCLAIPYWVIGGILKALFETIEDIIDYIQYMIDSRRFRKHYEETHPDIKAETSNLDNTRMEIIIKGTAKEIADLVRAIQDRQNNWLSNVQKKSERR